MRIKPRALVVDADPVVRLAIDRQLDAIGWDVYAVNNGMEALQVLKLQLRFDAMLVSSELPDLDDEEMLVSVAAISPGTAVILLCERPLLRNDVTHLVKPFSTASLAAALQRAIVRRVPWDGRNGTYPR